MAARETGEKVLAYRKSSRARAKVFRRMKVEGDKHTMDPARIILGAVKPGGLEERGNGR